MSALRFAHAGRWWAVPGAPALLALAALLAEEPWLLAGFILFAVPLAAILAAPILLRQTVARRRRETVTTRPFAMTTFGVWLTVLALAATFAVGRSAGCAPGVATVLLLVAWIAQLTTAFMREPAGSIDSAAGGAPHHRP